ncbi:MAG: hypothetical protein JSU81_03765 [Candidatus Coatesbacteria bacterium]|nr:MAG: hypothetical protein JSU81_03765 [Candidatus Coatesbacteria bacterium]
MTTPRRLAIAGAAVFILTAAACEEPIFARRTLWERVADYPSDKVVMVELAEGSDGKVYAAGWSIERDYGEGVIYVFDGRGLEESFRGGYSFKDIGFFDGTVWAVGSKWEEAKFRYRPYVVRLRGSQWEEVVVPEEVEDDSFAAFFPTATGTCWFAGYDNFYTYSGGNWSRVFESHAFFNLAVSPSNQAFYYHFDFKNEKACIFTSSDGGGSWFCEEINLGTGVYRVTRDFPGVELATGGDKLYLSMLLLPHTESEKSKTGYYHAIISREPAPAGEGVYEITFLARDGEAHVDWISCMGFRSATEGYACGSETAIAYEGGTWYPEIVEPIGAWRPVFYDIAVGVSDYWAIVVERMYNPNSRVFWLYRAQR